MLEKTARVKDFWVEFLGDDYILMDRHESIGSSDLKCERLDLRGTPCPLNFVRSKLKLQQMPPGSVLEIWLDPGEPIEQVPDSLSHEGYLVESVEDRQGYFSLIVFIPADHS